MIEFKVALVASLLGFAFLFLLIYRDYLGDQEREKQASTKLQEKTMYMELCADAGIPAFQCYDGWLRSKYNGD